MLKKLIKAIKPSTAYEKGYAWAKKNHELINPIQLQSELNFICRVATWGPYEDGIQDYLNEHFAEVLTRKS